jgi:hypothetical protein
MQHIKQLAYLLEVTVEVHKTGYSQHCDFIINSGYTYARGPGSSVCIATDYGLDGPGIES